MIIFYILPEIYRPGGIGRVTAIKANYFAKKGHKVFIITTDQDFENSYYELSSNIILIHTRIHYDYLLNSSLLKKIILKRKKNAILKTELEKLISNYSPNIIVSTFNSESDVLYKINCNSHKILECHFAHNQYFDMCRAFEHNGFISKLKAWLITKHRERISRKYERFIVLTKEDATYWNNNNLCIIPNMLPKQLNIYSDCSKKNVIAVGRLDGQKKFERLIEVWKIIKEHSQDWSLFIYGQGPDKEKLIKLINKYQLDKNIFIKSPVNHIEEKYLDSSILAMTSMYEGFGLVLIEAMGCGLPCIAYSCKCGPKDIIKDGKTGYLINEGDIDSYASKLLELMNNDKKRIEMGKNAKFESFKYSQENVMPIWEKLFNELIGNEKK